VVAATCLGVRHPVFSRRRFDVCVLDEAGQVPEPTALGPLRAARAFVLVGDHLQARERERGSEGARERGSEGTRR
jgi:DNA replication ATP-dependent helicase Dna2